jgi:hypothetical protein
LVRACGSYPQSRGFESLRRHPLFRQQSEGLPSLTTVSGLQMLQSDLHFCLHIQPRTCRAGNSCTKGFAIPERIVAHACGPPDTADDLAAASRPEERNEAHNPEVETKRFAHDTYRRIKERVRWTRSSRVPACKSQTPDSTHPDRWHLPPELAPVVAALLSFSAAADSTGSPEWSNCVWEERSEHYGRDAPPSPCASGTRERSMSSWKV